MREMKDSGIEWIGKIPENWTIKRLCYLIDQYKAGPFGSALIMDKLMDEGQILVYTPEVIAENNTDLPNNKYLQEERKKEMQQFFVQPGDIIFPIVGSLGRAMLIKGEHPVGIINQRLAKFRISSVDLTYHYFLWLFARSSFYSTYIELTCRGSIIVNLTKAILHDMPVLIPPAPEQEIIATFLDAKCAEIDSLTADIQSQIDTLEEYKRSVITETVTKGLNPDAEMKNSGIPWCPSIPFHWAVTNPKALFYLRNQRAMDGDRQLTASQKLGIVFQDEFMEMENQKVVTVEKDFSILKHVEPNDFVISMRSFQGGLEYSEQRGCISSAYVMLIPNKDKVYPPFFRWFFKSSKYINALQSTTNLVRDGQALRYANFVKVPLFIIPTDEQKQIAEYLNEKCNQIDAVLEAKREQLTTLEEYKKSLIYEYVTGKKEVVV